jgi:hypothetical protein
MRSRGWVTDRRQITMGHLGRDADDVKIHLASTECVRQGVADLIENVACGESSS